VGRSAFEVMLEPDKSRDHRRVGGPPLSACLVVQNEGPVVERCLRSLTGLDGEILVIHDGPCTDDTLDIARRYSARVFVRPLAGHSERHRPFAYQQARGEWLLNLDADEFLSPEMAAVVPELISRGDVDGFAFVWPLWDGKRPLTSGGPHRLVLMRRSATEMVGIIHRGPEVHRRTETRPEILHHQPPYDNFTWKIAMTKQRRWARLHGSEITRPLSEFPSFNYSGPTQWPASRRVRNYLSPLLAIPYGLGTALRIFIDRRWKPWGTPLPARLRISLYSGMYLAMVETYVARQIYLGPLGRVLRPFRTAPGNAGP
jgi:hypothetical protein